MTTKKIWVFCDSSVNNKSLLQRNAWLLMNKEMLGFLCFDIWISYFDEKSLIENFSQHTELMIDFCIQYQHGLTKNYKYSIKAFEV